MPESSTAVSVTFTVTLLVFTPGVVLKAFWILVCTAEGLLAGDGAAVSAAVFPATEPVVPWSLEREGVVSPAVPVVPPVVEVSFLAT